MIMTYKTGNRSIREPVGVSANAPFVPVKSSTNEFTTGRSANPIPSFLLT